MALSCMSSLVHAAAQSRSCLVRQKVLCLSFCQCTEKRGRPVSHVYKSIWKHMPTYI
jgi:hypothetical protein